eukprot:tig00021537_g22287.t1
MDIVIPIVRKGAVAAWRLFSKFLHTPSGLQPVRGNPGGLKPSKAAAPPPDEDEEYLAGNAAEEDWDKAYNRFSQANSLFIFDFDHPLREFCQRFVLHKYTFSFFFLLTLGYTISLSARDPFDAGRNKVLDYIDICFTVLFTIEFIMNVIARGFILHRRSYLRSFWHWLDMAVVVFGWLALSPAFKKFAMVQVRTIRLFRAFRGLLPLMKLLMAAVAAAAPLLLQLALLLLFFYTTFAIIGMQLFEGAFQNRCVDSLTGAMTLDTQWPGQDAYPEAMCSLEPGRGRPCDAGTICSRFVHATLGYSNPTWGYTSFDNYEVAVLTIFQSLTMSQWSWYMYWLGDVTNHWLAYVFFIVMELLGVYVVLNMFLAAITTKFEDQTSAQAKAQRGNPGARLAQLSVRQRVHTLIPPALRETYADLRLAASRRWARVKQRLAASPAYARASGAWEEASPQRDAARRGISTAHQVALAAAYVANYASLAAYSVGEGSEAAHRGLYYFFTAFFALSTLAQALRSGLWRYVSANKWNLLEAIVVVWSVAECAARVERPYANALRILHLIRLLSRSDRVFRILTRNMARAISSLVSFLPIFFSTVLAFSLFGMQLFGGGCTFDATCTNPSSASLGESPRASNFDSLFNSYLATFQVLIADMWNNLMFDGMRELGVAGALYFLAIFILGVYLMLKCVPPSSRPAPLGPPLSRPRSVWQTIVILNVCADLPVKDSSFLDRIQGGLSGEAAEAAAKMAAHKRRAEGQEVGDEDEEEGASEDAKRTARQKRVARGRLSSLARSSASSVAAIWALAKRPHVEDDGEHAWSEAGSARAGPDRRASLPMPAAGGAGSGREGPPGGLAGLASSSEGASGLASPPLDSPTSSESSAESTPKGRPSAASAAAAASGGAGETAVEVVAPGEVSDERAPEGKKRAAWGAPGKGPKADSDSAFGTVVDLSAAPGPEEADGSTPSGTQTAATGTPPGAAAPGKPASVVVLPAAAAPGPVVMRAAGAPPQRTNSALKFALDLKGSGAELEQGNWATRRSGKPAPGKLAFAGAAGKLALGGAAGKWGVARSKVKGVVGLQSAAKMLTQRARSALLSTGQAKHCVELCLPKMTVDSASCFFIEHDTAVRRWCRRIAKHAAFKNAIRVVIAANAACIAAEATDPANRRVALDVLNYIFTVVFLGELVVKVVAKGFLLAQGAYLRNPLNFIDALVVASSLAAVAVDAGLLPSSPSLVSLRAVRSVMLLRLLIPLPTMRALTRMVRRGGGVMLRIVVLIWLIWSVFGVVAVRLLGGKYHLCTDRTVVTRAECVGSFFDGQRRVEAAREWRPAFYWQSLDTFPYAMLHLFELATLEQFTQQMLYGQSAVGVDMAMRPGHNPSMAIFYHAFTYIGNWFAVAMIVGTIVFFFGRAQQALEEGAEEDQHLLSREQAEWRDVLLQACGARLRPRLRLARAGLRGQLVRLVQAPAFEKLVLLAIAVNVVTFAARRSPDVGGGNRSLEAVNVACAVFYCAEMALKVAALGPRAYLQSRWNRYDAFATLAAISSVIVEAAAEGLGSTSPNLTLRGIRLLRMFRFFRLFLMFKGVKMLATTLRQCFRDLLSIAALLLVVMFVYANVGVWTFRNVSLEGAAEASEDANFRSFPRAMVTLFRMTTGENWNSIMWDHMRGPESGCTPGAPLKDCGTAVSAPLFFVSYMFVAYFVGNNLFVAVVLRAFEVVSRRLEYVVRDVDLRLFAEAWERVDFAATGFIPVAWGPRALLMDLGLVRGAPLPGAAAAQAAALNAAKKAAAAKGGPASKYAVVVAAAVHPAKAEAGGWVDVRPTVIETLKELRFVPVADGRVHYFDVFRALVSRVYKNRGIALPAHVQRQLDRLAAGTYRSLAEHHRRAAGEREALRAPPGAALLHRHYAAGVIQAAWRGYRQLHRAAGVRDFFGAFRFARVVAEADKARREAAAAAREAARAQPKSRRASLLSFGAGPGRRGALAAGGDDVLSLASLRSAFQPGQAGGPLGAATPGGGLDRRRARLVSGASLAPALGPR